MCSVLGEIENIVGAMATLGGMRVWIHETMPPKRDGPKGKGQGKEGKGSIGKAGKGGYAGRHQTQQYGRGQAVGSRGKGRDSRDQYRANRDHKEGHYGNDNGYYDARQGYSADSERGGASGHNDLRHKRRYDDRGGTGSASGSSSSATQPSKRHSGYE